MALFGRGGQAERALEFLDRRLETPPPIVFIAHQEMIEHLADRHVGRRLFFAPRPRAVAKQAQVARPAQVISAGRAAEAERLIEQAHGLPEPALPIAFPLATNWA